MDPLCCHHLSLFFRPRPSVATDVVSSRKRTSRKRNRATCSLRSAFCVSLRLSPLPVRLSDLSAVAAIISENFSSEELFFSAITALFFFFRSLRAISTARLSVSPHVHLRPIDVVVSDGPLTRSYLGAGFVLRCFQHLSCPNAATRLCSWRNNRRTGGLSNTVLSY